MIIDANNMMIGRADHIREIGPHVHVWVGVGRDGAGFNYRECELCGARVTDAPEFINAQRRDWIAGGPWDVKVEKQVVKPATPEESAEALREQRAAEERMAVAADADADKGEAEDGEERVDQPRRRGRPPKQR